jgi:hypothetical protein
VYPIKEHTVTGVKINIPFSDLRCIATSREGLAGLCHRNRNSLEVRLDNFDNARGKRQMRLLRLPVLMEQGDRFTTCIEYKLFWQPSLRGKMGELVLCELIETLFRSGRYAIVEQSHRPEQVPLPICLPLG